MESYQLTPFAFVIRQSDNYNVPMLPDDADYLAYLDWLAAGNTPLPWGPPPVIPPTPAENIARWTYDRERKIIDVLPYVTALNDAIDLGVETAAEAALLLAWKQYRVDVWRTDISVEAPAWPVPPT